MCGICGIANSDAANPVDGKVIHRMCDAIIHRGPDDEGCFVCGSVGLGIRRLSIIDLVGGKQPVHNEDSTIQIVLNGEIYNFRDLKSTLEARGHLFYTQSDTETIVHTYEEYGEKCVDKLRGMFSLAIWDAQRQHLLLAVDRIGIKPLYYALDEQGLVFGSELKCVLASGRVTREMDFTALSQYFTFGYIPSPWTIFRGVYKLSPGHLLLWTPAAGGNIQPYWDFPRDSVRLDRSLAQTRQELRSVLRDAVRSHLISDVPLGVFLSGGIDSSTIVALMSEVSAEPVKTFSIGFTERTFNELDKGHLVAQRFHTEHHEFIVEPKSVDVLQTIVAHFGEPFADSSALPTYFVSKMARQYVKVALSGDGGDELFLGYTIFRGLEVARYAQLLPASLRKVATASLGLLPKRLARWKKRATDSLFPPCEAYYRKIIMGGRENIWSVLSSDLKERLAGSDPYALVSGYLDDDFNPEASHPLERFVYAGCKFSLPGDMLVKVDRMSMANSLEVRVPFLDHALVEFVGTIPIQQRFQHWRLKGLLKDTMADVLPAEILKQPKKGFAIPLSAWFCGDLRSFIGDVLLSAASRQSGYWNMAGIETLLHRQRQGDLDLDAIIWSLLVFELWHQQTGDICAF